MRRLFSSVVSAVLFSCTPMTPEPSETGGGSAGGASAGGGAGGGSATTCQRTLTGGNTRMGACALDPLFVAPQSKIAIELGGNNLPTAQLVFTSRVS